jgi:hypothetical protein
VRIIRNLAFVLLVATVSFVYNPQLAARSNDCPMNEIDRGPWTQSAGTDRVLVFFDRIESRHFVSAGNSRVLQQPRSASFL